MGVAPPRVLPLLTADKFLLEARVRRYDGGAAASGDEEFALTADALQIFPTWPNLFRGSAATEIGPRWQRYRQACSPITDALLPLSQRSQPVGGINLS
jgi:hypothetical protein